MLLARVVAQNKASNTVEASQGGHHLAGTGFPGGKDDQLQFYNVNSAGSVPRKSRDREHQIIDDTTASGVFNDQLPRPHR
jgi:hypothetical protein